MSDRGNSTTTEEREPPTAELRRAASEWCYIMSRQSDYAWFLNNWRLPGLKPFVEREMR